MNRLKLGDLVSTVISIGVPQGIMGVQAQGTLPVYGIILEMIDDNLVCVHCDFFGSQRVPRSSCKYEGSLSREEMLTHNDEIVREWANSHEL